MSRLHLGVLGMLSLVALTVSSSAGAAPDPFYLPPGDLLPASGDGVAEFTVFAPSMRYPLELGPSFPNSQVYGNGGLHGPGGSQCDAVNYDYPWRDNYCETRTWDMPLCPSGQGHQGQDVRPATCENRKYWIVASAAGQVSSIGSYSVYVTTPAGQRFDYLHGALDTLVVSQGQQLQAGDPIVMVSNNMGQTATSIHLHYNIKQDIAGVGYVYVSPYMSLVAAYSALMGLGDKAPVGALEMSGCERIAGWAQDPDTPEAAVAVDLYFGGPAGDPNAVGVQVKADLPREDLCVLLGSCDHGFALDVPVGLRDGQPHPVHVYAHGSEGGEAVQLELSPAMVECAPPPVPAGVRRWVISPEILATWNFSPFWQVIHVDDPTLAAIPESRDLAEGPVLARSDAELEQIWLIDGGFRRHVQGPEIAAAWSLDLATTATWSAATLQALPEGTPLRPAPILVQGTGAAIYLIDDLQCDPEVQPADPLCPEDVTTDTDGDPGGSVGGIGNGGDPGSDSSGAASGSDALPPGYGANSEAGCGCDTSPVAAGPLALLLGGLGLRRRRRS
ncbi:MAG: peptidoglycan DD-metalloendopeptidase family protein [Nannocystis sp.]|nr:M23 family metallopeptidase [Nannocystis sp.]MBA3545090.1 peptidoglycan DD-metalloendopeptidase family protein [Nannocystis sp.]